MSSDLIFHIVSKRKWRDRNKGGFYTTDDTTDGEQKVECISSVNLKDYLNENFKARKNLLLLVIDKSRLINPILKSQSDNIVWIKDGINIDAILDKIRIDCDKEGKFDLEVTFED